MQGLAAAAEAAFAAQRAGQFDGSESVDFAATFWRVPPPIAAIETMARTAEQRELEQREFEQRTYTPRAGDHPDMDFAKRFIYET